MATINPFDLLDDDAEDPSLIAAQKPVVSPPAAAAAKKGSAQTQAKPATPAAKLPSKPLPPSQAVREAKNEGVRGGRGGGRGYGRGRGGYNRDFNNSDSSFANTGAPAAQGTSEDGDAGKSSERRGYGGPRAASGFHGGRHRGFANGEDGEGERPRRIHERRSGTGRGNEMKREGAGRGNWGTQTDELAEITEEVGNEGDKNLGDEKPVTEAATDGNKENLDNEPGEKEPEEKEMTLEEYEKVLEEKRKALLALKTEERKVDAKEFQSMQQISSKKENNDVFIKLGSDKDKRKEASEKAKKSVSINEFLKPAEGERYHGSGGRGRGRGRGARGFGNRDGISNVPAPSIEDPGQFPTLGGK
ncbi:RGG repeats nuclear RNA binding protein A-like [Populus nigra]|uniref:RGG repeats nuclear RNA binding protein A-like n=1 Tax=Populus nigra TaxID=3691 RepID=UPI002B277796|nr:RGG repeats nuclear RNA binding protein A-like [Populus nigra]XP_061968838.1 RGG repeats nuclear RNA binding protein A-like [Populus nigra]